MLPKPVASPRLFDRLLLVCTVYDCQSPFALHVADMQDQDCNNHDTRLSINKTLSEVNCKTTSSSNRLPMLITFLAQTMALSKSDNL